MHTYVESYAHISPTHQRYPKKENKKQPQIERNCVSAPPKKIRNTQYTNEECPLTWME